MDAMCCVGDSAVREGLAQGLAEFGAKLSGEQAALAVGSFAHAMTSTVAPSELAPLSRGLAALVARLSDPRLAVSAVLKALANPLVDDDPLLKALHERFPSEFPENVGRWAVVEWDRKHR